MQKLTTKQTIKLVSVLYSCEKYEQALTWLAWFDRLKIDNESKKNLKSAASKIVARIFPKSEVQIGESSTNNESIETKKRGDCGVEISN